MMYYINVKCGLQEEQKSEGLARLDEKVCVVYNSKLYSGWGTLHHHLVVKDSIVFVSLIPS